MKVFVLTSCCHELDLWGNCIFYDSVRNSFPDNQIIVYDNHSLPFYRRIFKEKSNKIGAYFKPFIPSFRREYSDFMVQLIHQETEPFYLIHPDTIWSEPLPQHFDAAIAGTYTPSFYNHDLLSYDLPRIHTGCVYIDPIRCKNIIEKSILGDELIHQTSIFSWNKLNYWIDDLGLFYTLYQDQCQVFSDDVNAKYLHLFCGTHISFIQKSIPEILVIHEKIQSNLILPDNSYPTLIKKFRKEIDDLFESWKWGDDVLMPMINDSNIKFFKNLRMNDSARYRGPNQNTQCPVFDSFQ